MAAIKRYNNVQLDGKPMKLELVGANITAPDAGAGGFTSAGSFGDSNIAPRRCVSTPDLTFVLVFWHFQVFLFSKGLSCSFELFGQ